MPDYKIPMGFDVSIDLLTSKSEVEKMALIAMRDFLNKELVRMGQYIKKDLIGNTNDVFTHTPEYVDLVDGFLTKEFGFPKGEQRAMVDAIVKKLGEQIYVEPVRFSISGNTFKSGGLNVLMFKTDFAELLALPEAEIITADGEKLPWLEWLLLKGDQIIIQDYEVKYGNYGERRNRDGTLISRSGLAIMKPNKGAVWKVPIGRSGTKDDNWITRACAGFGLLLITQMIEKSILKWMDRFSV